MKLANPEIKEAIIRSGFVTESEVAEAEKIAHDQNRSTIDVLVERGIIIEKFLGETLASRLGFSYADLKDKVIGDDLLKLIPENLASEKRVIAFDKRNNTLLLAMEDPSDVETIEYIKKKTGLLVEPFFTLPAVLNNALDQYRKNIKVNFETAISQNVTVAQKLATISAKDTPVVKILETLLEYAASEKASDIHIENVGDRLVIRFRVDGKLRDVLDLPSKLQSGLITRIKILSSLRTDEHRIPQDGRFRFRHRDDEISARVSILPTYHGEDAVLRLLSAAARPKTLEGLGLTGSNLEIVKRELKSPKGMALSTGPTGSGKTTTLYNLLTLINTSDVNICTIEDPIEYGLPRVNQTQVNPAAGFTFANGLRSILRHDPDIVLVGEIRDNETAEIAVHAALTGHLVLSSLHTNSAVGAIPRLLDLGVQPYLIGSSLSLIIAQRLVAKNDQNCIVAEPIGRDVIASIEKDYDLKVPESFSKSPKQYKGKGCKVCNNEGFNGRIGVFEVLIVSEEIRELIFTKAPISEIEKQARKEGFKSMLEDGLDKVQSGSTTMEEVLRAVRE
ncbi:MAG: GspE/PulE family protein [Candidatus Woykebacteria bacterium]